MEKQAWIWEALGTNSAPSLSSPAASSQAHSHAQSSSNSPRRQADGCGDESQQDDVPLTNPFAHWGCRVDSAPSMATGAVAKLTFVRSNVEENIFYILLRSIRNNNEPQRVPNGDISVGDHPRCIQNPPVLLVRQKFTDRSATGCQVASSECGGLSEHRPLIPTEST